MSARSSRPIRLLTCRLAAGILLLGVLGLFLAGEVQASCGHYVILGQPSEQAGGHSAWQPVDESRQPGGRLLLAVELGDESRPCRGPACSSPSSPPIRAVAHVPSPLQFWACLASSDRGFTPEHLDWYVNVSSSHPVSCGPDIFRPPQR